MNNTDVTKKRNEKRVGISVRSQKIENVRSHITPNFRHIWFSYFCPYDEVEKDNCQNSKNMIDFILKINNLIQNSSVWSSQKDEKFAIYNNKCDNSKDWDETKRNFDVQWMFKVIHFWVVNDFPFLSKIVHFCSEKNFVIENKSQKLS